MKSLFPEKIHRYIYVFALSLLVIGLPLSKFLMSLSQIILLCNWVLEGGTKNKLNRFIQNKTAIILSSLFLLHIVGVLYTSDYAYAYKDLRIKLPILLLPIIISSSKGLSEQLVEILLQLFVGAVLVGTGVSVLVLTDVIHRKVNDIRDVSIYISHIRFALLICLSVFVLYRFVLKSKTNYAKIGYASILIWLIYFLVLIESLTGLIALSFALFILLIIYALKSPNKLFKYGTILTFVIFAISGVYYLKSIANENQLVDSTDFRNMEKYTPHGAPYEHDTLSRLTENGHLIWTYYSSDELKATWNKRSSLHIDSADAKGNTVFYTLIRFLTSKGLRKDLEGVYSLSNDEIKAIENGCTNANYQKISSLRSRIYETLWELDLYEKTGQASGHSLTQRFEYWKNALSIIKNHLLFGVGTGDIAKAFEEEYVKNNSTLDPRWRLRSHNQYLSIAVAFGLFGLVWFLITLIYPLVTFGKNNYLYTAFFVLAVISFFTEDTLETQAGVTFFAFFNTFLLFAEGINQQQNKPTDKN